MIKKLVVQPNYHDISSELKKIINTFNDHKELLGEGKRNIIKVVVIGNKKFAVKSFKKPNIINKVVYRFFRKSKAERSYNYANQLLELGIKTPFPVAYQIEKTFFSLNKSYYISELVDYDFLYKKLTMDFSIPDYENILRAFTKFTFNLHKNKVHFLDHSPGNTLIKRVNDDYEFYLVDLNRMKFESMDFNAKIKNFSKLTIHKSMVTIMSNEYAKCSGEKEEKTFDLMWHYTKEFQHRFYRKIRIKKRLFFWKKKYKNKVSESPI